MTDTTEISAEQIKKEVLTKLDQYKDRSVLEAFAIFMGKAQMLEFALKGLLVRKFYVPLEETERWTLGVTKNALKDQGIRQDFIALLQNLVDYRNSMAHEFFVNIQLSHTFANFSEHKLYGDLFRALYALEQVIIIHDWCERNDEWLPEPLNKSRM